MDAVRDYEEPPISMTGLQMQRIREGLGLTRVQFGNAIGYNGNWNTVNEGIKQYENERKPIPRWIAVTVRALDRDGLLEFITAYKGRDDRADFVRALSVYLVEGQPK